MKNLISKKKILLSLIYHFLFIPKMIFSQGIEEIHDLFKRIYKEHGDIISITPIHAGLTNSNYKVLTTAKTLFVRIGNKESFALGIDREKEKAIYQIVMAEKIAPEIIFFDSSNGNMISQFINGTPFGKLNGKWLYDRNYSIEKIIHLVKKYHACQTGPFEEIDYPFQIIDKYLTRADSLSTQLPQDIDQALKLVRSIKKYLGPQPKVLCHQDLFADNFVYDGDALYLVDWEYGEWSDPFYDLASLCVEQQYDDVEKELVLSYYFEEVLQGNRIHLEMMCMLYSLRVVLWSLNEHKVETKKDFDFLWLADLHYQNFFKSIEWLKTHDVFQD